MKHNSFLPLNVQLMILSSLLADTETWEMSLINTVYEKLCVFFFFLSFQASQVWQIKAVESLDLDKNLSFTQRHTFIYCIFLPSHLFRSLFPLIHCEIVKVIGMLCDQRGQISF